ncbi:MAG: hypothetical protein Q7Q73_14665 [Verrucomicrobiota bacterium JB024]|nr:hypothetical protein [Verrucomicrobiota bacterium JB024]
MSRESLASGHPRGHGEAARSAPEGAPALPGGPQGGAAALPCLKNNNSTETLFSRVENGSVKDYCKQPDDSPVKVIKYDSHGRHLVEFDDVQMWFGGLTPAEKKKSFALVENLKHMVSLFGLERLGFLTLTFAENISDFKEAQRRFNSLASHLLRKLFRHYVAVVEPQLRGAVHYHLVVVCLLDIRTGFDFAAFYECQREFRLSKHSQRFHVLKRQYTATASPTLRELWKQLRTDMKKYGFGRSELLPIRSNAEGIALYVGKYLEKGSMFRGEQFKGARRVRYSRGWKKVSQNLAWLESGQQWRNTIAQVAALLGAKDMDAIKQIASRSWAYDILTLLKAFPDATPGEIAKVIKRPLSPT